MACKSRLPLWLLYLIKMHLGNHSVLLFQRQSRQFFYLKRIFHQFWNMFSFSNGRAERSIMFLFSPYHKSHTCNSLQFLQVCAGLTPHEQRYWDLEKEKYQLCASDNLPSQGRYGIQVLFKQNPSTCN